MSEIKLNPIEPPKFVKGKDKLEVEIRLHFVPIYKDGTMSFIKTVTFWPLILVAKVIEESTTLIEVRLNLDQYDSYKLIDINGLDAIENALTKNTSIKKLNVYGNSFLGDEWKYHWKLSDEMRSVYTKLAALIEKSRESSKWIINDSRQVTIPFRLDEDKPTSEPDSDMYPSLMTFQNSNPEQFTKTKLVSVSPNSFRFDFGKHNSNPALSSQTKPIRNKQNIFDKAKKDRKEKTPRKPTATTLTQDEMSETGRWGEKYIFEMFCQLYQQDKYKNFKLTGKGFTVEDKSGTKQITLVWHNFGLSDEEGTNNPCDMYLMKKYKHEGGNRFYRYIEVKATRSKRNENSFASFSEAEVMLMRSCADEEKTSTHKYRLFRVYATGTNEAEYQKIKNPFKEIMNGELAIKEIQLKL